MRFDNLTNKQKSALVKAGLKGFIHATVVPLFIIMIVNNTIDGNFGGAFAVVYIIFIGVFYNKIATKRDFSKIVFNYTAAMVYGVLLGITGLGLVLSAF